MAATTRNSRSIILGTTLRGSNATLTTSAARSYNIARRQAVGSSVSSKRRNKTTNSPNLSSANVTSTSSILTKRPPHHPCSYDHQWRRIFTSAAVTRQARRNDFRYLVSNNNNTNVNISTHHHTRNLWKRFTSRTGTISRLLPRRHTSASTMNSNLTP